MPNQSTIVLGVSYGHGDSSAALVVNRQLVAAVEEERFTRVKHYAHFPLLAIQYCLQHAGVDAKDVGTIAIARKPWNAWTRRLRNTLAHPQLYNARRNSKNSAVKKDSLATLLNRAGLGRAKVVRLEHHLAHMLSARYLSSDVGQAFLSFDGLGDYVSTAIGRSLDQGVEILDRVHFPHSLGYFYTALTQYLGFPHFGDEFKVMGLSSYGKPTYLPALRDLVREKKSFGFELNLEAFPILKKPMNFYIEKAQPYIKPYYNSNYLTQILGIPPRKPQEPLTQAHSDLAKSIQARFEEVANVLLGQLHDRVGCETLALAGGCAHNSVWVGKIPQNSPYKKIFVAPASHDAGIAVGAAIHAAKGPVEVQGGHWGLLGPSHEIYEAPKLSESSGFREHTFGEESGLIDWMVDELRAGKIIGLYWGRMEFGPRALGSRSIIADPRVPIMKNRLNDRVKHRESFRPFAASVLAEHQEEWFENTFFSPTMEAVFNVLPQVRDRIPAVVHVDQTCRIQSVTKETQPFYWALIEAFRKKTGVPMLLNTSFNDCEPIVCTKEDALKCFKNTDMDHLVVGLQAISRIRNSQAEAA